MDIDRSTIWPYDDGEPGDFIYQRYAHPAGVAAERRSASSTAATRCSSRPAAARRRRSRSRSSRPATTIALAEGAYFGTGGIFRELARWGLRVVEFDQTGTPPDDVELVWLEAPSNPFLTMPDLDAAAAHPARVVVDATAATPIHLRPLEHGADFVLHSATKYLAGHDDVLLGAVVCKREDDAERLKEFRTRRASSRRPTRAGCCCAASRRSRCASSGRRRPRLSSRAGCRPSRRPDRALPRLRRAHVLRRRGRRRGPPRRDLAPADHERDEPRRRPLADGARARWEGDRVPAGLLRLRVGLEGARSSGPTSPGPGNSRLFSRARVRFPPEGECSRQAGRRVAQRSSGGPIPRKKERCGCTRHQETEGAEPCARNERRAADGATVEIKKRDLRELLAALRAASGGDIGLRLSERRAASSATSRRRTTAWRSGARA